MDTEPGTFAAPIAAVEVFRNSALVHRRGALAPSGDRTLFELGDLPMALVDGSVRVALEPVGGCRVIDLQIALDLESPIDEHDLAELEEVKTLRRSLEDLRRRRQRLSQQAEELMRLRPELPPAPRRPDQERFAAADPSAGWLGLLAFTRQQSEEKLAQVRALDLKIDAATDELGAAEDRLRKISTARQRELQISKKVLLRLEEPPPAPLEVRLTYQVMGARWFPSYELRVEPQGQQVELVMNALVAQVTGEDWRQVSLSLSTADLQRRCDLPRLGAWRIGKAPAADRPPAWRPLPDDLPRLFDDYDREQPSSGEPVAGLAEIQDRPTDIFDRSELTPLERSVISHDLAASDDPGPEDQTLKMSLELPRPAAEAAMPRMAARAPAPQASPGGAGPSPKKKKERAESLCSNLVEEEYGYPVAGAARDDRVKPRSGITGADHLAPVEDLLSYDSLVLPPADALDRGALRIMDRWEEGPGQPERPGIRAAMVAATARRTAALQQLQRLSLPRGAQEVHESAGHFAYRYETDLSTRLSADGRLHRIGVLRQQAPLSLVFRAAPLEDPSVHRLARIDNPLTLPLLAGPLDVFWGNDFLVTSRLSTTAPGARIETSLGVEPRIKVARNVKHSQREEGLLSGKTVYEEEIDIEIASALSRPCSVEVLERVPVSDERKVDVTTLDEQPPAEAYDQAERQRPVRGGRRWRLELEPGGRRRCALSYRVTLPSSSELVGGGRRA